VSTAVGFLPPLSNYDQYRTLGEIRPHTFVVSGGADILTRPRIAAIWPPGFPAQCTWAFPTAGHMLPQEACYVISDAIGRAMFGSHAIDARIAEASERVLAARRRGSTSERCSG
jgi:hypothetical protein